ncbi:hypothetical protein E4N62_07445 [Streptomyces sp. MNU76]|uniref:hypothetical protein n=1 Tax=Streptomyces sp. MNU76 TaxID=2560026 RepID=UPI001E577BE3|nr:hypothetical protein [Streptomyces sp. MNU76]MCC9705100.1 hypothetical protein [Streptomyces sp. MNU76]
MSALQRNHKATGHRPPSREGDGLVIVRTSTEQDTFTDHLVVFLSRVSHALRKLADSADHAAKVVRKADAARRS